MKGETVPIACSENTSDEKSTRIILLTRYPFKRVQVVPNNSNLKIVLFGAFSFMEDLQKEIPDFLYILRSHRNRKSHYRDRPKEI